MVTLRVTILQPHSSVTVIPTTMVLENKVNVIVSIKFVIVRDIIAFTMRKYHQAVNR